MKKNLITLIGLLMMLPIFCQEPDILINRKNKTVTLNKEKTIEISKIISNEERQEKRIIQLENILKTKDSIINQKDVKIDNLIKELTGLGTLILKKEDQIKEVTNRQLEFEKKKSKYGLYLFTDIGTVGTENYNHIFFGAQYVTNKMIYGLSLNPVNSVNYYSFKLGFKIL